MEGGGGEALLLLVGSSEVVFIMILVGRELLSLCLINRNVGDEGSGRIDED